MKLKTLEINGKTYAETQDGKPVFVMDDGKEIGFDAVHSQAKISSLNAEAKGHREAKEAAEEKLKAYEGIDDPEMARKAIETTKNLDQGQLFTAGKVDEIKAAAKKTAEEQVAAAAKTNNDKIVRLQKERDGFERDLYAEKVGGAFSRSKFISEKMAVPADMLQAMFGNRFKVEDGKVVGYDTSGNKLFSRTKPGDLAEVDEALEQMVEAYPYRDTIMKGTGASGSGAHNSPSIVNGKKTMTRDQLKSLPRGDQAAAVREHAIVD